jgi:hypothetical protein
MKAYQRFSKAYSLFNAAGEKVGEYTTVDGAHAAASRKNLENYEIKSNY